MTKPKVTFEGVFKQVLTIGVIVGGVFYVEDRLSNSTKDAIHSEMSSIIGRVSALEKALEEGDARGKILAAFMTQQVYRNKVGDRRVNDVERFLNKKFPTEYLKPSEITFEEER